jgi:uncharacterized protein involved in outer membrane biogenesis
MNKLVKACIALICIIVVAIIGLSAFVKVYVTDERVRAVVIPPAEQALGRKVSIGAISVNLFNGITIRDFAIKEADGNADFVGARSFVLRYDLLPLLKKKLIISEARLESPSVNIYRDKQGAFNYETLAVLQKHPSQAMPADSAAKAATMPLALTISQVKVDTATISFKDNQGDLPAAGITANVSVSLDLESDLSTLRYQGQMDANISTIYGDVTPRIALKTSFDEIKVDYSADLHLDGEDLRIQGRVENYMQTPAVALDLTSKKLNLDRLLAITATMQKTSAGKSSGPRPKASAASRLPPGFTAKGTIRIDETQYQKMTVNNFTLSYQLKGGILTISDLTANTAGGTITSNATVDLNKPEFAYNGDLNAQALQLSELAAGFAMKDPASISGFLQTSMTFTGAGTEWDTIKNFLTADATYSISDARFRNTPLARTMSSVIGLPELNDMTFKDVRGDAHLLKGGRLNINSTLSGNAISATTAGTVGLDGSLDMPLTMILAPALAEKIDRQATVTRLLNDDQGNTVIPLKIAGTLTNPKPTMDTSGAQKQVTETVKRKALEELGKVLSGSKESSQETGAEGSPTTNFLKGILGR